jgi:adenylate cyclase
LSSPKVVHEEIDRKLALTCDDLGDQTLKNIAAPIRVYRIADRGSRTPDAEALPLPNKPSIAVLLSPT